MRIPLALMLVAGCGIPGDTPLLDLDGEDWRRLCEANADPTNEVYTAFCDSNQILVYPLTVPECVALGLEVGLPDCTSTVRDWRDCQLQLEQRTDAQICDGFEPPVCLAIEDCQGEVVATPTPGTTGY